jgi:homoserine kinase
LKPFVHSPFSITVPATSANLGPGFDAIGLALDLFVRATVRPAERFMLSFAGGRCVPTNDGFANEIIRAMDSVLGIDARPNAEILVENDIPLGKGLGASAAGAVLGVTLGAEFAEKKPSQAELARVVCELEGHPDNALPALLGGIVVAAMPHNAAPAYLRFDPPPGLRAVLAVPRIVLPTAAARALLPQSYERRDVVFNIQRAALLAASFASGDLSALRVAVGDRIHQPYRAPLVPGFAEMLALDMPGLLSITLSGAGPSVLALASENLDAIGDAMRAAFAREGIESEIYALLVSTQGARIVPSRIGPAKTETCAT